MRDIFPWQQKQWDLLQAMRLNHRLPHALLFVGASGLGKVRFAEAFSEAVLCESSGQMQACGVCHACNLVRANSHPDLCWVTPEQTGQMIKIDQIRRVVGSSNETAMQGGYKVIIIHPAQAMNQYAANALLKTLEEATPNTLFILISEQNLRLPKTITSRCQKIVFQKPEREDALNWLKSQGLENDLDLILNVAEGSPLKAKALVENKVMALRQSLYQGLSDLMQSKADPLQLALQWQEFDILAVFQMLLHWLRDLLRLQLTNSGEVILNRDFNSVLPAVLQKVSRLGLLRYVELVQERYACVLNLQNVNRQLLLEELLIGWVRVRG